MVDDRELTELVLTHAEVLNSLLSEPKTKPELVEECDVSRTTIDRWISRLQEASLIHRPEDRFKLTLFGQIVTLKFDHLRTQFSHLIKLREPLRTLSDELDIDPAVLQSATVSYHEGFAPELGEKLLSHAGRTRLLTPHIPCAFSVLLFRNPNPNLELEVVFEEGMATQLDAHFTSRRLSALSVAEVKIYETADSPPFCLALVERDDRVTAYVIFEGPRAGMGVIESDAEEAVEWGAALYAACRDRATEYEWLYPNQSVGTLPNREQCLVLLELMAGNASHETDVMTRASNCGCEDGLGGSDSLHTLDEAGYIEWDRETGEITEGPNFDAIRPILKLIMNHPSKLP